MIPAGAGSAAIEVAAELAQPAADSSPKATESATSVAGIRAIERRARYTDSIDDSSKGAEWDLLRFDTEITLKDSRK
jgi:hypothetical protein